MGPKRVADLTVGDLLDLAGDPYADPDPAVVSSLEFEYVEVLGIERETAECIRVDTNVDSYGFPPNHTVTVATP